MRLDEDSSLLTTFNTLWDRFTRLPFGLKVSSDVFQERLDAVLAQLERVVNIADDCLVNTSTYRQDYIALLMLLHTARLNDSKFNSNTNAV